MRAAIQIFVLLGGLLLVLLTVHDFFSHFLAGFSAWLSGQTRCTRLPRCTGASPTTMIGEKRKLIALNQAAILGEVPYAG